MTVYLNVVAGENESNFEFHSIRALHEYYKKFEHLFLHFPKRLVEDQSTSDDVFYYYNHNRAMRFAKKIKVAKGEYKIKFIYTNLAGVTKIEYFDDMYDFKDHWASLGIDDDRPKVERQGDAYIYTYREDKMYADFAAEKIAPYAESLPPRCEEVRFCWIERSGKETQKPFENLNEFWDFFNELKANGSCSHMPEEFYDEDDEIMYYIYDVVKLSQKSSKPSMPFQGTPVATFGENRDQRVVY